MSEINIMTLIRTGKKEYMENLYYKGQIYCNTIDRIRRAEGQPNQFYDPNDSLITQYKIEFGELKSEETVITRVINGILSKYYKGNLYCFYGVKNNYLKI